MKLSLRRNGVEIGQTYAGLSIGVDGVFVSPAMPDWTLTVPEDSEFPLPGLYDFAEIIEPELEQTPEDIRAAMPAIYPTDFARLLQGLRTENYPDGVLPSDVEAIIDAIPDKATRELARWDFNRATKFERTNPLIDQIGNALGLTPEQIDAAWMAFVGALA